MSNSRQNERQTRAPARRQQAAAPAQTKDHEDLAELAERLVGRLALRYGVAADKFLEALTATVFKVRFSPIELAAALTLCEEYELNPFAKEIYVADNKGTLLVIVSVDGWSKIANRHPQYDGVEFDFEDRPNGDLYKTTCRIFRRDRSRPTEVPEFFDECKRDTEPWKKWPRRMLRHKAFIQACRLAFSLSSVIDPDEAGRMGIHQREPEYRVTSGNRELDAPSPSPSPSPARPRRPPREVKATEPEPEQTPAEEEESTEPQEESEETKAAKRRLVAEWKEVARGLDAREANEARDAAGIDMVSEFCTLAELEVAVRKASELAEGKRQ